MINVNTKIHDKFSVEFKVGFAGSEQDSVNDFTVNSWIFLPYSLDINSKTYSKEQFYRDVKSNIRLITPNYTIAEMAEPSAMPLSNVRDSYHKYIGHPIEANLTEYNFQVRMFAAIFKSALRNEVKALLSGNDPGALASGSRQLMDHIGQILRLYRQIRPSDAKKPTIDVFAYADEFMSHLTDVQFTKLIRQLGSHASAEANSIRDELTQFLLQEREYKTKHHYSHLTNDGDLRNRELVYRHSLLKKNIESVLYLKSDSEPDNKAAQQFVFAIAAGIAMLVYVLITLPLQKYFGNYPTLILIILVVSYILKDRIKEFFRGRFAYRLKDKYYDDKTNIHFQSTSIGWIKEGADFITDAKTPAEVLEIRNRSRLEADNALLGEQTILYRKQVHIDNEQLRDHYRYTFTGINDIMRLHIQHLTQKMDDPEMALQAIDQDGRMSTIHTQRIYPIHIVLQFIHGDQIDYRAFRITATRDGIIDCIETTLTNDNQL